jgi:hypothetical protein
MTHLQIFVQTLYHKRTAQTTKNAKFTRQSVGLPAPECLMVQQLASGGLEGVGGQLCYHFYETLR